MGGLFWVFINPVSWGTAQLSTPLCRIRIPLPKMDQNSTPRGLLLFSLVIPHAIFSRVYKK